MKLFDVYPLQDIVIEKGEGCYVWDEKGEKYLDFYGGHAVISIGHSHPKWKKRIEDQLDRIAFYSNSVKLPIQQELATAFGHISGRDEYQLFLCNSGAEANENALKLASFYNGRKKIISFSKAFHGRTSLAVAVTDNPAIRAGVNENENVVFLPFNDKEKFSEAMERFGNEVAAVIVESIQGVGGIRLADEEFLQLIRSLCDRYGSVVIADEVQCGYGRTGKFFAADHAGIDADIYTMAKGMGNGFPVAGIAIHPKIAARHFMLGTTFGGNPLACAAALAVLEVMEEEKLMANAERMGRLLMNKLHENLLIQQVRGKGLMIGFDVPEELKDLKKNLLVKHHIFTGEAKPNVIRLLPPLNITGVEVELFYLTVEAETSFLNHKDIEKLPVGH